MLTASMVPLFMTLLVKAQECDKTHLLQVMRNTPELGKQPDFLELDAGQNPENCVIPIAGSEPGAYLDWSNPGNLSDGCWGGPIGPDSSHSPSFCTDGDDTLYRSSNTYLLYALRQAGGSKIVCIRLPANVCPTQVVIQAENLDTCPRGQRCVETRSYDTTGITCNDPNAQDTEDCADWEPDSGKLCIALGVAISDAGVSSTDDFDIKYFDVRWNCGNCGAVVADSPPSTSIGSAIGDPHLRTMDGEKYLLLQQGSFNFWHFSGLDAEAQFAGIVKKVPLDFRVFTHYSGRKSYTKSLLFVDHSGPDYAKHQRLEITSEDCIWRSRTAQSSWHAVDKPASFVSDQDVDEMSAMRLGNSAGPDKPMHVELLMKDKGSLRQIAKIIVVCRPNRYINTKLVMFHKEDFKYVSGQLGMHTEKAELLQESSKLGSLLGEEQKGRTDSPFLTTKSWTDLGGSEYAAAYLSRVDEEGPAQFTAQLLSECDKEREDEAKILCAKHLVRIPPAELEDIMAECVFDVCREGGEVAAQLFGEIYTAQ